jgi:hypothetical protein
MVAAISAERSVTRPRASAPAAGVNLDDLFRGPWFTSKIAAEYVCCRSVNAFYSWKRRHFIVSRSNGTVAKADLDRALKAKKGGRGVSPATLRNLELGRLRARDQREPATAVKNAGESQPAVAGHVLSARTSGGAR